MHLKQDTFERKIKCTAYIIIIFGRLKRKCKDRGDKDFTLRKHCEKKVIECGHEHQWIILTYHGRVMPREAPFHLKWLEM